MLGADGRLSRWGFAAAYVGVSVLGVGGAMLAGLLHPALGLIAGLGVIAVWTVLSARRLHDLGLSGWLQAPATAIFLIGWVVVAATNAGWITRPLFHGPIADVIFSLLAFLMLGFYLTLLTQPSRPGAEEG